MAQSAPDIGGLELLMAKLTIILIKKEQNEKNT